VRHSTDFIAHHAKGFERVAVRYVHHEIPIILGTFPREHGRGIAGNKRGLTADDMLTKDDFVDKTLAFISRHVDFYNACGAARHTETSRSLTFGNCQCTIREERIRKVNLDTTDLQYIPRLSTGGLRLHYKTGPGVSSALVLARRGIPHGEEQFGYGSADFQRSMEGGGELP
jgi:hypothetical protein